MKDDTRQSVRCWAKAQRAFQPSNMDLGGSAAPCYLGEMIGEQI